MKRMFFVMLTCTSCFLLNAGCGDNQNLKKASPEDLKPVHDDHDHDHHHVHKAPHGGHLVELGDHKYNAEIVFTKEAPKLTIYLLGAHAENSVAIPNKEITFDMETEGGVKALVFKAQPQDNDPTDSSSKFVLGDAASLPASVTDIEKIHGSLTLSIKGENFTGNLTHSGEKKDDHDHDHAKDDHKKDEMKKDEPAKTKPVEETKKTEPAKVDEKKDDSKKVETKTEDKKPAEKAVEKPAEKKPETTPPVSEKPAEKKVEVKTDDKKVEEKK